MAVKLDVDAGREVFISHYEVGRATVLSVDLDDERSFAGISTNATLSLVSL
jgi:hypothetical protein